MDIYLLHEYILDGDENKETFNCVYPYQDKEVALKRIANETGETLDNVKFLMASGNCACSGAFAYRLEETELR